MCRVIDHIGIYKILKSSRGYTVINTKGTYDSHGHFKKLDTCYLIIRLIHKRQVPRSKFLRQAVMRIATDDTYIEKVQRKIDKDRGKGYYYNPQKGVR